MKFFTTSRISENIHETPEGYLLCIGVPIARTGEMVYGEGETPLETDENGQVIVSRSSAELFRPETVASFQGKAVTIRHPNDFVSADNHQSLAKGHLQNVRRGAGENADDLLADLLITDSRAIELVKAGLREVSCGYGADYTQSGIGRGFQTNIVGNHLALVEEGRAGAPYAIKDHKRPSGAKGKANMKLKDKIKAIFAKAQDEALEVAGEGDEEETPPVAAKAGSSRKLMKAVMALDAKVTKLTKDMTTPATASEPAKTVVDEEPPVQGAVTLEQLAERLAKLEAAVSKLLGAETGDGDEDDDEESDTYDADEDDDESDEVTDSGCLVGDAARVEILAPGMDPKQKNVKSKALIAASQTRDGKAVIKQLTGGKGLKNADAKTIDTLFVSASELLKVTRRGELASTKTFDANAFPDYTETPENGMSAEDMNKKNEEFYKARQA